MHLKLIFAILSIALSFISFGQNISISKLTAFKIIAQNNSDTSKATGFIINKENLYFLVTAKHVFYPPSTQSGYTLPSFANSLSEVIILDPNNFSQIQKEQLVDVNTKTLLYKVFTLNHSQALDIAVLKINNPTDIIKKEAIPYSFLEDKISIDYNSTLRVDGYPAINSNFYSIICSYVNKDYQAMLDEDSKYYFILNAEEDLKGISGSPVFSISDSLSKRLTGIFVGQNRTHKTLGYAIFSFYIKSIIDTF